MIKKRWIWLYLGFSTYCKEGIDVNSIEHQLNQKRAELWENVVKMAIITRDDLMVGNPKLAPA